MTNSLAIVCSVITVILVYPLGTFNVFLHLVVLGFSLKFLELKSARDVHFFINTGLVLVALFLIFNHSIMMASAAGFTTLSLLAILLSLHGKVLTIKHQFKLLSKAILLSLPLALVLFVVIPRLPSFWKIPLQKQAITGLSDSVSPGSIAQLSQSSALAFRVSFTGHLPSEQERYWRVLTLDKFDGKTWSQNASLKDQEAQAKVGKGDTYHLLDKINSYQLMLEPHYQHYVPSLDFAQSANDSLLLSDYSLRSIQPVYKRQAFEINQYKQIVGLANSPQSLQQYIQLPDAGNPQTKHWINQQLALGLDKYNILKQLLAGFYEDNFRYTLKPPILGEQQIDDFLFSSQAGFCVHYASAYLFVARALNIPARMVTGYLGGEWQASEQFLTVRQYDAHAWVEIWKDNQWLRIDPTAYVSPERVEQGIMQGLDDQSEFLSGQYLSIHRWQNNQLLNQLRHVLARADYIWAVWVINYDNKKQFKLLRSLVKKLPWLNISMMILLLLLLVTSTTLLLVFKPWQRSKLQIEDRIFTEMYEKTGKKLLLRKKGQTVADYCGALAQHRLVANQPLIDFAQMYNQIKFQVSLSATQRKQLITQLALSRVIISKKLK
jgi:transglutaminase-like putative cysteine protease